MQIAVAKALHQEAPPPGLISHNGSDVGQRFAIYRNNVTVALLGNLASRFPVVRELLGAEAFTILGHAYVAAHPPRSAIMHEFGSDLARFIQCEDVLKALPYLSDVARLEFAQGEVFYEQDCVDLDQAALSKLAPEDLNILSLTLKKAHRIVASNFPIHTIWAAHQGEGRLEAIDLMKAETVLIYRRNHQVHLMPCSTAAAHCISEIASPKPLNQVSATPEILQETLGQLLRLGLVSSFTI